MIRKRILLTGATGQIGQAIAQYLAAKPYHLIMGGRNTVKLFGLAEQLEKQAIANIDPIPFDYGNPTTFSKAKEVCATGLDGLVLMTPRIPAFEGCFPKDGEWEKLFKETFVQPLSFLKEFIEALSLPSRAKVVIISGIASVQVLEKYALNGAIRTAWVAQAKTLAHFYGPASIHFNTLSLGGVMTTAFIEKLRQEAADRHISYEEALKERTANIPLRKYASPIEVAQAVESLLGEGTDHITGMNFMCDGGFIKSYGC